MKAQTADYLEKSQELLNQAEGMLRMGYNEPAGRTAYLAGLHAAQALLFETRERLFKTHEGVNRELHRLLRNDLRVDDDIRGFLGRTYRLKEIADCLTGPGSPISPEMARDAVDRAHQFVERITSMIPAPQPEQQHPTLAERFGTPPTGDQSETGREPDGEPAPD